MDEITGLFPIPFMRAPAVLGPALVDGLIRHFAAAALRANTSSANLSHTEMLQPADSPLLVECANLITPKLVDFGALLFGERIGWSPRRFGLRLQERSQPHDARPLQRRQVGQPRAAARRPRAVPQLPHACGAAQSRRAAHHHGVQCHFGPAGLRGQRHRVLLRLVHGGRSGERRVQRWDRRPACASHGAAKRSGQRALDVLSCKAGVIPAWPRAGAVAETLRTAPADSA